MAPTEGEIYGYGDPTTAPPPKHTRSSINPPDPQFTSHYTQRITNRPSHLYLNRASESFTHDELLTSIPRTPPPATAPSYFRPTNSLLTAVIDFELSIEIRDRLTRTELVTFDRVFVSKIKDLGKYSVEGTYSQKLQVLKRLTKARAHLKKCKPEVVDDVSRIVNNLLRMLDRDEESVVSLSSTTEVSTLLTEYQVIHQQPKGESQLLTPVDAEPAVIKAQKVQLPEKMLLSSILYNSAVIKRTPGHHQLYLHFNEKEACLEVKGLNGIRGIADKKIACAAIRTLGDMSSREVRIGTGHEPEIRLELKDEKDAEALLHKLELLSGVTAYTARCY